MGIDFCCWLIVDGFFICLIFVVKLVGYFFCDYYGCFNVLYVFFCFLQGSIVKIEKVYDVFFGEFLLCYGYWKKYVDYEMKLGFFEKIVDVYECVVKFVMYFVDIWMYYCVYVMEKFDFLENIRRCVVGFYCYLCLGVLFFI